MNTSIRRSLAATGAATLLTALGALATMQPASAMPADATGSPGTLSGNVVGSQDDDSQVIVTPLTEAQFQAQFKAQRGDACTWGNGVTYCQDFEASGSGSNASVSWTAYISVPTDNFDAAIAILDDDFEYTSHIRVWSGYAKVQWLSPDIPVVDAYTTVAGISLPNDAAYEVMGDVNHSGNDQWHQSLSFDVL